MMQSHTHTHATTVRAGACLRTCLPVWRADVALCLFFKSKKLPLHWAAACLAGPEVVTALLQAYPAAASTADMVRCGADIEFSACSVIMCGFLFHACALGLCTYMYVYIYVYLYMYENTCISSCELQACVCIHLHK